MTEQITQPIQEKIEAQPAQIDSLEAKRIEAEIALKQANAEAKMVSTEVYRSAMAVQTTFMNPNAWTQIRAMSKIFYESKAIPSCLDNEAKVVMCLQAGFEMGMTPVESLHSLYPVNGSWNIWGKAVPRRLREHGWRIKYSDESDESCTATVSKGDESYTETYTFEMADQSGYTRGKSYGKEEKGELKIGWKLGINRKLKLRYGVLLTIIKSYIPDVLGSVNDIQDFVEEDEEPKKIEAKLTPSDDAQNVAAPIATASLADKLMQSRIKKEKAVDAKVIEEKEDKK